METQESQFFDTVPRIRLDYEVWILESDIDALIEHARKRPKQMAQLKKTIENAAEKLNGLVKNI